MAIHGASMTIVRIIKNNFNKVIIQSFLWKRNWKKTIFLQFVQSRSWNQVLWNVQIQNGILSSFEFLFFLHLRKKNDKNRIAIFLFTKNKSKSRCGKTSRNKNRKWCYFNLYRYMNGRVLCALCCVRTFVYILYLFRFFGAVQIRNSFDATTEMEWRRHRQMKKVKIKIIKMKQRQHGR